MEEKELGYEELKAYHRLAFHGVDSLVHRCRSFRPSQRKAWTQHAAKGGDNDSEKAEAH